MNYSGMTVRAKLGLAFGALATMVVAVAGLCLLDLQRADERFEHYMGGINARVQLASGVRAAVDQRAIAVRNLVLVTRPDDLAAEKATVLQAHKDVQTRLAQLVEKAQDPSASDRTRQLIGEIAKVEQVYGPIATRIVDLALAGQHEEAIARMNDECRPNLAALGKASAEYARYAAERSIEEVAQAKADFNSQRNLLVAVCAVALVAAMAAGIVITQGLTRSLGAEPSDLSDAAKRVAEGDLRPIAAMRSAPAGSVMQSLGAMQASLASIVKEVRDASESIASGSSEIASGNSDLSHRTEEQASALQQTAATMDQLGATVRNNSDNASRASQLATGACDVA